MRRNLPPRRRCVPRHIVPSAIHGHLSEPNFLCGRVQTRPELCILAEALAFEIRLRLRQRHLPFVSASSLAPKGT